MGTAIRATCNLLPNAKVLAMFAFDSYSQSKRSPRPLSRHRPCKTPFPIGNATFNKLPRFYLKWVFLINSQWNAGFIQPFLPRTAESASSPSIVATATAEPGSPTNFAPISFSAWNSAHHRPGKVTAKKEDPAAGRNHQKPAKTSSSCHSGSRKNLARVRTVLPKHQFTTWTQHLALTSIELYDGKSPDWTCKDNAIKGKQVMIATGKILAICFPPSERKLERLSCIDFPS